MFIYNIIGSKAIFSLNGRILWYFPIKIGILSFAPPPAHSGFTFIVVFLIDLKFRSCKNFSFRIDFGFLKLL